MFDASKPVQSVCLFLAEFDPITFGDLRRAEIAREKYKFDRVEFIPVAGPSQTMKTFAPAEIRYEMALAATNSNPYFAASRFDIDFDENSYPLFTSVLVHRKYMKSERPDWMVYADWLNPEHPSWIGAWVGAPLVLVRPHHLCTSDQNCRSSASKGMGNEIAWRQNCDS